METLPAEIQLAIVDYLYDTKDKIELGRTCRRFERLLYGTPRCWSPLDLSLYANRVTNAVLLSMLRARGVTIVPSRQLETPVLDGMQLQLDAINLSGCHLLSSDAVLTVVRTLPRVSTLIINRYPSMAAPEELDRHPRHYKRTRLTMIDMLRDDLYQCRPRHGLASTTMDLSKQPLCCLSLADITLRHLFLNTKSLSTLSLQHQALRKATVQQMPSLLPQLRSLDISSCDIAVPDLQLLLRTLVPRLHTFKMLNLDLTNLTLLGLQLHGRGLQCLHLSCIDPQWLPSIVRVVQHLSELADFRMTRLRSGNIDALIAALALRPNLTRLDLSPKLELYPKFLATSSMQNASNPHQTAPQPAQTTSSSNRTTVITMNTNNGTRTTTITTTTSTTRTPNATVLPQNTPNAQQRPPTPTQPNVTDTDTPRDALTEQLPPSPPSPTALSSSTANGSATNANSTQIATNSPSTTPIPTPTRAGLHPSPAASGGATVLPPQAQAMLRRPAHVFPPHPHYHPHARARVAAAAHYNNYSRYNNTMFTRAEHNLLVTPGALQPLAALAHLVELRLCFPTVDKTALARFFRTTAAAHTLRILELRLRPTVVIHHVHRRRPPAQHPENASDVPNGLDHGSDDGNSSGSSSSNDDTDEIAHDYIDGIDHLTQLHTLQLFHVPLRACSVDTILGLLNLQSLTLYEVGPLGKLRTDFLRTWMTQLPRLNMIRMDLVPFSLASISDLLHDTLDESVITQAAQGHHNGDTMLLRQDNQWQWID
ncbi:hypothetical protein BC940DRAFT_310563 [Gongronella butleri]|nr:hypothetical protein BC940DRAFT_310563 [Gongronella butleri]